MRIFCLLFLAFFGLVSAESNYRENLSDYGFFSGSIKDQIPADGVTPYALNSPLFSDYALSLIHISEPTRR
jgi:hypothetical protein